MYCKKVLLLILRDFDFYSTIFEKSSVIENFLFLYILSN